MSCKFYFDIVVKTQAVLLASREEPSVSVSRAQSCMVRTPEGAANVWPALYIELAQHKWKEASCDSYNH